MSRVVLRQFFLATSLVVLYILVLQFQSFVAHPGFAERSGGRTMALLLAIPNAILFAIQVAVGVSLSLVPRASGAFRTGMVIAAGVTALLVIQDIGGHDLWQALERRQMGTTAEEVLPERFDDTTSALGGSLSHLLSRVRPEDIQQWPPDTPAHPGFQTITDPQVILRMSAVQKYSRSLSMLSPLILGGLVVGFCVWLGGIATFRSTRDERVLRLTIGWCLSVVTIYGLPSLSMSSLYTFSSPRLSLGWMIGPYLAALVPAALGWRALWRLDRLGGA